MTIDGIVFTGERLDRAADRRTDPDWVSAQAADPSARAVVVGDDGVRVTVPAGDGTSGEPRVALLPLATLNTDEPLLLGLDETGPVFAVDEQGAPRPVSAVDEQGAPRPVSAVDEQGAPRPVVDEQPPRKPVAAYGEGPPDPATGTRPLGLRAAAASLPQADGGLAAHAAALVNWHRRHRHCAVCGTATQVADGGIVRRCPRCGTQHHPRTDPVVIMLVTDGDRVLLGRQRVWPPNRYSALAGFVEPGESLEEAVVREVREEAGVEVGAPQYVGSQPWPFPTSLMLGFMAPYRSGEPHRVDEELEDVRWFSRDEVGAAITGETDSPLGVPPPFAIARRLMEQWVRR
jgi:NAD+ diphosphatase